MTRPLLVGITGGIGSGKSTIAEVFRLLQVPVYDADSRAKLLMVEDDILVASVKQSFGPEAYTEGKLNRQYLAERVFANESETAKLNSLVHPAVARDFASWVSTQSSEYILKEAALLFETGSYKDLDKVILVTAPEEVRISRVQNRDPQRSDAQIRNIISKQIKVSKAMELADYTLPNDGSSLLIPQIIELDKEIKKAIR